MGQQERGGSATGWRHPQHCPGIHWHINRLKSVLLCCSYESLINLNNWINSQHVSVGMCKCSILIRQPVSVNILSLSSCPEARRMGHLVAHLFVCLLLASPIINSPTQKLRCPAGLTRFSASGSRSAFFECK